MLPSDTVSKSHVRKDDYEALPMVETTRASGEESEDEDDDRGKEVNSVKAKGGDV